MFRRLIPLAVLAVAACGNDTPVTPAAQRIPVVHFPKMLDKACRDGDAKVYDECGSQIAHYCDAVDEARKSGKVVLVNLGAEWCIWCHVFDAHLDGETGAFDYSLEGKGVTLYEREGDAVVADAKALNAFAAKTFVVLHLEADHAPDAGNVLELAGVDPTKIEGYPYIFSLNADGKVAAVFVDTAEIRREGFDWYRGYDRRKLLKSLVGLRDAARAGSVPEAPGP